MKVLEAGHKYELLSLDGGEPQILTFVKREGEGYPGNVGHHPGTTLQEVLRAEIDRGMYVGKLLNAENVNLAEFRITLIPDDVLWNNQPRKLAQ
jgi:hypothetical protein